MSKFLVFILLTSYLYAKIDIQLSHKKVKNGTTFAVILQSDKKLKKAPNVIFKNKTYQMFTINGSTKKYEVFIPISYYAKKEKENIQIIYLNNQKIIKKNIAIYIIDGNYKKNEIIKVQKSKVTLSKKNKNKASNEYNKVYKNVYSYINPKSYIQKTSFILPINSKITSSFGTARVYNKKTKSYHTGTDFKAKKLTEITASNNGRIALVMKRFYLGNVVYIDHGRGLYTYYSHLNKAIVKENGIVQKGDIIGYSGSTGRVTGPHLHYANRLYNITVDPLQFADLYNDILNKYH